MEDGPYLRYSFQKIFKILVSILPYIFLPQPPELSINSTVQSDSHKLCKNLEEGEP